MIRKTFSICYIIFFSFSFAQTSIFDSLSAAQYLPKETLFLLAANNPESLLNRLGREDLIQKYQSFYAMAVSEMTNTLGHNLFDMNTLRQLGVNPSGSCGMAFIENRPEKIAFFFALNDPHKAQETILNFAQKFGIQFEVKALGNAILLNPGDILRKKFFYILRGNYLFFLGLGSYTYAYAEDGSSKERTDEEETVIIQEIAKEFAQVTYQDSLAQDPTYQKMSKKLSFGQDAGFYVNMVRITEMVLKDAGYVYTENLRYYEEEIQAIRSELENSKEPPEYLLEELKRNEQILEQKKQWFEESKKRAEQEFQTVRNILGGLEGIIASGTLTSNSLQVRGAVAFTKENHLLSSLRNTSTTSLFLETLQNQPLVLLQGSLEPAPVIDFLNEVFFKTRGIPLDEIKNVFKREFQIDLDQELFPLFTGEAGIAVTTLSQEGFHDIEKMSQNLNISAMIQLTNGSKAQDILNRILAHPQISRMLQKNNWNGGTFPTPWKPIHFAIIKENLVISTETPFFEQLQQGVKNSFVSRIQNKDLQMWLQSPNTAIKEMIDFRLIASFLIGIASDHAMRASTAIRAESAMSESSTPVPYSEEYLRKQQEIVEVEQKIKDLEMKISELQDQSSALSDARNEAETKTIFQIFEKFGITAISAKVGPNEIIIEGGHFLEENDLKTLVSQTIETALSVKTQNQEYHQKSEILWIQINKNQQQSNDLWQQKSQLEEELREIRHKDILEYQQKKD
ncbi:MAG: hypothetical protein AABZ60_23045 [Planctomycetota bacterium]